MRFLIWIPLSFAVLISPASSATSATNCEGEFAPKKSITAAKVDGHIAWLAGKDEARYPLWTADERKAESAKPGSKYYCEGPDKNAPVNERRHGPFKFDKLNLGRNIWCNDVAPLLASTGNTSTKDCLAKDGEFDGVTEFKGACFRQSDLRGLYFRGADLRGANFFKADLSRANLANADLTDAILECANLTGADLDGANLKNAILNRTMLEDAFLGGADVEGARFEPVSLPPTRRSFGIKNLNAVIFESTPTALAEFRRAFADAGMYDDARRLTRAINASKERHAEHLSDIIFYGFLGKAANYGESSLKPWMWLLWLIYVFSIVYYFPISQNPASSAGIWRRWPKETIEGASEDRFEKCDEADCRIKAYRLALYFSFVSAFEIGFRGLNVGNWITRITPAGYVLEPRGWVKAISGIQSLSCLVLLAVWVIVFGGTLIDEIGSY